MAITKGWDAAGYAASGTSVATAVSGQPTAGSTLVVWVINEFDGSETFSGLTDNAGGNTYTNIATASLTESAKRIACYRAVNINTAASFQVTGTWSASTFTPSLSVIELIGVDNAAPVGVSTVQQLPTPGTGTDAVTSGSAGTPSEAGHAVVAAMRRYSGGGTSLVSVGTGYTTLHRFPLSSDYDGRTEYLIQGAAAGVAGTFTQADAGGIICGVASFKPAASGTFEQEGFRWYEDNGSESGSSAAAAQDTNITAAAGATKRLRMLVNATGDPATKQFKLQWRKTAGTWADVL